MQGLLRHAVWYASHLIALFVFLPGPLAGQQTLPDSSTIDLEVALESLDAETQDLAALVERLLALAENPLDINHASEHALAQIPPLGLLLARAIVAHRMRDGPFQSLAELQDVAGMTPKVYHAARPYVTISNVHTDGPPHASPYPEVLSLRALLGTMRFEVIQRITRRLDLGRGYQNDSSLTSYLGSPERLYTRFRARSGRTLSLNLTVEKDPGEPFEWIPAEHVLGFDHISAHLAIQDVGRLTSLIIGDYEASFGQGLSLWRSIGIGKGRDTVRPVARRGLGYTPYGSTNEHHFFRGLATTVRLTPALSVGVFASRRRLDGTLRSVDVPSTDNSPQAPHVVATGISQSGLHRTETERSKRNRVRAQVAGGHLMYAFGGFHLGMSGYQSTYTPRVDPGSSPGHRFAFRGQRLRVASVFGHIYWRDMLLFGELGYSHLDDGDGHVGTTGGVLVRMGPAVEWVMQARLFPRDFVSLHGFTFGERGLPQNETGIYTGVTIHTGRMWTIHAYADHYRFPWVRSIVPRPSSGFDVLGLLEYAPRRWLNAYLQLRHEAQERSHDAVSPTGQLLDGIALETRQSLRLHTRYAFGPALSMQARLEGVRYATGAKPTAFGMILYQGFRWQPHARTRFDARLAFFDASTFDARVFAFEHDLLYTFSVPSYAGRGQRVYVMASMQPTHTLTVQVKYAVTCFEDVHTVGSGLDEIEGDRIREMRFQLRWQF